MRAVGAAVAIAIAVCPAASRAQGVDAIAAVAAEAERDERLAAQLEALPSEVARLPAPLADHFGAADLDDPKTAAELAAERARREAVARAEAEALDAAAAGDPLLEVTARRARARAELAAAEHRWLTRTREARIAAATSDEERALTLRTRESEREAREARAALARAREAQKQATTPAELALSAAREALETTRAEQAGFERRLLRRRSRLAELEAAHARLLAEIGDPAGIGAAVAGRERIESVDDPRFHALSSELAAARVAALDAIRATLRDGPEPPAPAAIDEAVVALAPARRSEVEDLVEQHRSLEARAADLAAEARETIALELAHHVGETRALTKTMVDSLAASPALRSQLRSLGAETGSELRGEAVQAVVLFGDWALRRLEQLSSIGESLTDWSALAALAWLLAKLALLLIGLRWALARWPAWIQRLVEAVGATLSYGQAAIFLVRIAESARHFGPPLLVLLAAAAGYQLFADLAGEAELLLALVIAVAAIRLQLRVVESACDRLAVHAADKERERHFLELDDRGEEDHRPPEPIIDPSQSGWKLFAITWRRLTRYVSVFTVLLVITDHTVGRGVFWGLVIRWGWLGAIPLTLFFLRTWRQRIIDELDRRAPGQEGAGPLSRLAAGHSKRFYGVFIVFAASLVVLGRRAAALFRDHLTGLDSTRRLLAFLFRRRVQKHAREHGRVLEKPHALPAEILEQFPVGPVPSELRPLRPQALSEIAGAHARWLEDGSDGSVAIVGSTGMGKSTLLELLPAALETGTERVRLDHKITDPAELVHWLARSFGIEGKITSERQLIAALDSGERRVLAIDDCQNMFLRAVGGFEAWSCFCRLVNETNERIFWIVALSREAWDYLSNVGGNMAYVRKVIEMPAWSEIQLRRLILTRMRRAGYRVNFSDLLVTRLENVKVSSQIIRTSQGYFRLLWDYADGNPGLACFFWLRSLVPDPAGKSVRVHLFAAPRIEELQALPDDIAFVLTAVVEHESASAAELATITNLPEPLCRFAVHYGVERGYLEGVGDRVKVSALWQQTVFTYLKRKHLLYS